MFLFFFQSAYFHIHIIPQRLSETSQDNNGRKKTIEGIRSLQRKNGNRTLVNFNAKEKKHYISSQKKPHIYADTDPCTIGTFLSTSSSEVINYNKCQQASPIQETIKKKKICYLIFQQASSTVSRIVSYCFS